MHRVAFWELIGCWVLWFCPFVFRTKHIHHGKLITVPWANWGALLQLLSYLVAGIFRNPRGSPPGAGRVAASMILAPLAVILVWLAVAHLGRQWRIQAGLYPDHKLVQSGPYRFVRHPIYASMLALLLATGLLITWWPLLVGALTIFIAGTEIRVQTEDRLLASRFQEAFTAYREKVPAYVPFVR